MPSRPGTPRRKVDARGLVDRPRDAEDHTVDQACVEPARLGEAGLEGLDRRAGPRTRPRRPPRRPGAPGCRREGRTRPRAGSAPRGRGPGRARPPGWARRTARHSDDRRDRGPPRGRGTRSGACGARSRPSASSTGMPRGRGAEIGAPVRMVSRTVRSFRSFNRGGMAGERPSLAILVKDSTATRRRALAIERVSPALTLERVASESRVRKVY